LLQLYESGPDTPEPDPLVNESWPRFLDSFTGRGSR